MKHPFLRRIILIALLQIAAVSIHAQRSDWKELGPLSIPPALNPFDAATGAGPIYAVSFDPKNASIIYAGGHSSGFWKSIDGGKTWKSRNNGLPQITGIQLLAVNPKRGLEIYISLGTNYGFGIYKSVDGGESWQPTGLNFSPRQNKGIRSIAIDPSGKYPNTIVYASEGRNVWRTSDGGKTWSSICLQFPGEVPHFGQIQIAGKNVFVSTGKVLWRTTDAGATTAGWKNITDNIYKGLKLEKGQEHAGITCMITYREKLMVLHTSAVPGVSYTNQVHIRQTIDGGQTWSTLMSPVPTYDVRGSLLISPNNPAVVYFGGTQGVYRIDNSSGVPAFGQTSHTMPMTPDNAKWIHDDIRSMGIMKGKKKTDVLVAGNDGGVSLSYNGGTTWSYPGGNQGLGNLHFYGLGGSADGKLIAAGAQDNGVMVYNATDQSWKNATRHQDAGNCLITQNADGTPRIYAQFFSMSSEPTRLLFSNNLGLSWRDVSPVKGTSGTRPMVSDKYNNVYIGYHDLFRISPDNKSINLSHMPEHTNPREDGNVLLMQSIGAVAVAPSDTQYIYFAYENPAWGTVPRSKIWKTKTGGGSFSEWEDISNAFGALVWMGVADIAVHPRNPEKIWISLEGMEDIPDPPYSKVWTYDGVNWKNMSEGLPNLSVNCLAFDSVDWVLYAGTDAGIYYFDNAASVWQPFMQGSPQDFPKAKVTGLEINYATRKLRASTYGRGVWETVLLK